VSESPAESSQAEQLVEELQKAKVSDLLLHTSSLLASLAYGKLAPEIRDLEQARVAIDALTALGPLLEEAPRRDIEHVTANLKLAYAEAAAGNPADS
jgi:hypothetical protein